jgi:hypothetical protein
MKPLQSRRAPKAQVILYATLAILLLLGMGMLGIEASNDVHSWNHWLKAQATPLLIWRLTLYGTTAYGWYRMRLRLINEGLPSQQRQRLLYAEMSAVVAIAALELNAIGPI